MSVLRPLRDSAGGLWFTSPCPGAQGRLQVEVGHQGSEEVHRLVLCS